MIRRPLTTSIISTLLFALAITASATKPPATDASSKSSTGAWNPAAAARYLDEREVWWQDWPRAQKDHGTVCISCHTQVPYALARPALRNPLHETAVSTPEQAMLDSVIKRVNLGNEAETFYSDAVHGPGKTKEARNAESVNNVVILTAYDAQTGHLQPATRKAFEAMWALQEQAGPKAGAWLWQNFHFSPWEAPESEYYGAAMAALTTGTAPDRYAADPAIQPNLALLRGYLQREAPNQPLINRVALLWASSKLSGLLTASERDAIVNEVLAKQQPDGGWCLTNLGSNQQGQVSWKRHDQTPFDLRSDGYATGIVVLALEENGLAKTPAASKGLAWLTANQNKTDGFWPAWSLNVKRDPNSDIGKFMSDAATAFSVLALEKSR
jgi:squalene-hopene/tetraprenyl-beta-curcumene cyclase